MSYEFSEEEISAFESYWYFGEPSELGSKVMGPVGGLMAWINPAEKDELESAL